MTYQLNSPFLFVDSYLKIRVNCDSFFPLSKRHIRVEPDYQESHTLRTNLDISVKKIRLGFYSKIELEQVLLKGEVSCCFLYDYRQY